MIGIIYGAIVAAMQTDLKRVIAYSSVAHMGFVVLGIFSLTVIGIDGAVFTMLSHPLTTGALFLVVGMLYERRHTREIRRTAASGRSRRCSAGCSSSRCSPASACPASPGSSASSFAARRVHLRPPVRDRRHVRRDPRRGVLLWAFQRAFTGKPDG